LLQSKVAVLLAYLKTTGDASNRGAHPFYPDNRCEVKYTFLCHGVANEIAVTFATCCNQTMDVQGVGDGPVAAELSGALRSLPGHAVLASPAPGDTVTAFLHEVSAPEVLRFLATLELPPPPEMAARVEGLIRAAVSAAAEGNVQHALASLTELAPLDPGRAETLEIEPGLASIRAEVGRLMFQLTSTAHADAGLRLVQATHLLQAAGSVEIVRHEINPEIAILIAGRLLEAGGYANNMHSIEVSQTLINPYASAPAAAPPPIPDPRSIPTRAAHAIPALRNRWMPRIKKLWLRAPLLVLLLVWLALGFSGGSVFAALRKFWPQAWPESLVAGGFEVWALGFLALIAYGFYARVRHIRW